jgi:hypothetical protein
MEYMSLEDWEQEQEQYSDTPAEAINRELDNQPEEDD